MSKVLLVGGSGYLGRHLLPMLSRRNEVYFTGRTEVDDPKFVRLDFQDESSFINLNNYTFDTIIILAADFSGLGSKQFSGSSLEENVINYGAFLDYLYLKKSSANIVYISSMTVYSPENSLPVSEIGNVCSPPHVYGLSKLIAEQLTEFHCRNNSNSGLVFRIPGLFGGDRKSGLAYNMIEKLRHGQPVTVKTDGLIYWETASVIDIASMIDRFLLAYKWDKEFDVFNLGYGAETDIVDFVKILKSKLSSDSKISEVLPKGYVPFYLSNEKSKSIIEIEENLEDALNSYIEQVTR
jgi:nucleoside-diphosphate-sugar epimerase